MPDSETTTTPSGIAWRSVRVRATSTLKSRQVAVVDPDDLGLERKGALELARVVHLDEHVETECACGFVEGGEVGVGDRCDDQQCRVGAGEPGLEQLVAVDDEVLAQNRQSWSRRGPRAGRRANHRS